MRKRKKNTAENLDHNGFEVLGVIFEIIMVKRWRWVMGRIGKNWRIIGGLDFEIEKFGEVSVWGILKRL